KPVITHIDLTICNDSQPNTPIHQDNQDILFIVCSTIDEFTQRCCFDVIDDGDIFTQFLAEIIPQVKAFVDKKGMISPRCRIDKAGYIQPYRGNIRSLRAHLLEILMNDLNKSLYTRA